MAKQKKMRSDAIRVSVEMGQVMRSLRSKAGFNKGQVGAALAMNISTITRIENGGTSVLMKSFERLVHHLGTTVSMVQAEARSLRPPPKLSLVPKEDQAASPVRVDGGPIIWDGVELDADTLNWAVAINRAMNIRAEKMADEKMAERLKNLVKLA